MCERCCEIDDQIERYRQLTASLTDKLFLDAIAIITDDLEAEKLALHPEWE